VAFLAECAIAPRARNRRGEPRASSPRRPRPRAPLTARRGPHAGARPSAPLLRSPLRS
jgi:hypothetical protein